MFLELLTKSYFKGHHVIPGVDTANVEEKLLNIPKSFFYGTYKARFSILNKNKEICGCFTFLVEIKRPWEMY